MYEQLAPRYDDIYRAAGKDYAAEAAQVIGLVEARNPSARTLLDVACGTGAHLEHLRERLDVAGVDGSEAMLARARERLPGVRLERADMRDLDLGQRFDAVTCLFSSVGHLAGPADLDTAVARMAAHLASGGVLVVEGWVTPDAWRDGDIGVLAGKESGRAFARMHTSRRDGAQLRMTFHHLLGTPEGIEYVVSDEDFMLFTQEQYVEALKGAGLLDVTVDPHALMGRGVYLGTSPR